MGTRSPSTVSLASGLAFVLGAELAGCSGGGGTSATPPGSPELLFSITHIPEIVSISSDSTEVYLGSAHALGALDKLTGLYSPLVGELIDPDPAAFGLGVVEHPSDVIRSGDWLYFDSWGYRIQRLFIGADGKAAIEEVLPLAGIRTSCCQLESMAVDDLQVYWARSGGDTNLVYARAFAGGEAQLLATVLGQARLTSAPSRLYVATITTSLTPTLSAINLASGTVDTIQAGIALSAPDSDLPRAASTSRIFWMDGTTLRSVAHDAVTPQVVATGLTGIRRLATDGVSVYALQVGSSQAAILRVDIASGSVTPIVTRQNILGLLAYQGRIWWVSGWTLEVSAPDGSGAAQLYTSDGTVIAFGGDMVGVSGRVVAASGARLLVYDTVAGTSTVLTPVVGATHIASDSKWLYGASDNDGVARIPVDVPLRAPDTLAGGLATIEALFLDQGWLYWSEYSDFWKVYRISRMQTDGTGKQVLFDGVHRQLALYGGRLFFLCEAACSLSNWTLVSMPLGGGPITPEVTVGLWPQQLIVRNGLLYVVDTVDGTSFGVWAIDLAAHRVAQLARDLGFTGITIDASSRWLYVGICPFGTCGLVDRRRIVTWDQTGSPQLVDPAENPGKSVLVFHTDGTDLYYWLQGEGLKRVPE